MEAMRESWTDRRLDEFRESTERRFDRVDRQLEAIDQRFDAVDQRFDAVDQRFKAVDERFDAVDQRFAEINHRFDAVDQRFEMFEGNVKEGIARIDNDLREVRGQMAAFQRMIFQLCGGMIVTVAIGFAGIIVTHL
jgi:septal ring factor EnvC (AmiA/AmiB activator)